MPANGGSLESVRPLRRNQDDQLQRIVERQATQLARGDLGLEELSSLDRSREPPCALP